MGKGKYMCLFQQPASTSALEPGNDIETVTRGGAISVNSEMGNVFIAKTPTN